MVGEIFEIYLLDIAKIILKLSTLSLLQLYFEKKTTCRKKYAHDKGMEFHFNYTNNMHLILTFWIFFLSQNVISLIYRMMSLYVFFMTFLNKHAPLKFKHIRANDSPFMTKYLRKALTLRSKLLNKFNKDRTTTAHLAYKKQRIFCTENKKGIVWEFKSCSYFR